jgi:hypothetical protein
VSSKKKKEEETRKSTSGPTANGNFKKFIENDLHVHVEPQQTSGSINLRGGGAPNNKLVGVLHIPLGQQFTCIDSSKRKGIDANESTPSHVYAGPLDESSFRFLWKVTWD